MYKNYNSLGLGRDAHLKNENLAGSGGSPTTPKTRRLLSLLALFCLFFAGYHANAQTTTLISPTGDGGFETGATFAANNWTTVNTATSGGSQWFITLASLTQGTYTFAPTGSRAAFISNNAGAAWRYNTLPVASSSHIYKDITFPSGQTSINLSFRYNVNGNDTTWDEMYVYLCPQTLTPLANSPSSSTTTVTWSGTGTATLLGSFKILTAGSGTSNSLIIPSAIAGNAVANSNMRLVFTWKNDGSGGAEPPAAIDDVSLVSAVPTPISGTKTVGPTGDYASLTAAFTALGGNGVSGPVVLELQSTYVSTVESFPIAPGVIAGSSSTNTVTVRPASGAVSRIITSTNTTATINLNGSSNIIFDGRPGGTGSLASTNLTIANTSTTTGGTAIQFINDANNNTVQYANLSAAYGSTTSGVLNFLTTTGANGNDTNTITLNNINGVGTAFNGIYASGSTTTTATNNSGVVISNNNIYDFFSAGSATNGISISSGNTDWTISGNRIFQTASRTYTTSNNHMGIFISNTSGNNFSVSSNTIGGGSSLTGGPVALASYTIAGTVANRYRGISMNVGTTTASNVQGNTISNFTFASSSGATTVGGPWCGIYVGAGNVNIGNTSANTIGSGTGTGSVTSTISSTGGISTGIFIDGGTTHVVSNNIIGSITALGSTASISAGFTGIRVATSTTATVSGNTIGSTATANSITVSTGATGTTAGVVGGINNSSTATIGITGNTIANLNSAYNPTTTSSNLGFGILSSSGINTITGNTVRNISAAAITTGSGSTASVIGISMTSSTASASVSQNTIFGLANTNAGANANAVVGIHYNGPVSGTNTVARNLIYNLSVSATSASASTIGINVAGGLSTFQNNMIRMGSGLNLGIDVRGINDASGTNNYYFNTVYVMGAPTSNAANTFAFTSAVTLNTRAFQNNVFWNARSNSGSTGKHYGIAVGGTGVNPTGLTSNYNDIFANGTGGVFGLYAAADQASRSAWNTASGQDGQSISTDPQLIDATNATTPDLHIHATNPTSIEGAGLLIASVVDDFDGQTRSGLSPTDIGADAGNFVASDISAPAITYTALTNNCGAGARTLVATITDASGVPTAGAGLPVLYFKVNAGAYTAVTATSLGSNQYQFVFGGAAVASDVVSYYIVAQDNAAIPNVGSFPATGTAGFTASPPAAATPPTTPSTYTVLPTLSGTKTVGSGGDYATLTAAVAAYNSNCLTGAVVFSLTDATYASETYPITINANAAASAVNTLTITPATGVSPSFTGSSASALVVINGADYVTIEGSNSPVTNTVCPAATSSRNLTLTNTNAGTTSAVVWLQTNVADGATNNTVRNCNLVGSGVTQTLVGVGSGSNAISTTSLGTSNNNNTFENNAISGTQYAIFSQGASTAVKNSGTKINQNVFNTSANAKGGIVVGFENGITISGNNISNIAQTTSPDGVAIAVGLTAISATTSAGNEVTNATVTNNVIGSVVNSGTFSAAGIAVAAATSGTTLIANNMISGVAANGTSGDFAAGIIVGGGVGSTTNVYHNTVAMQGTIAGATAATQTSACLAVTNSTAPTLDLRNNIFTNTQIGNSGATIRFAAIALAYSTYTTLTTNNNNLYVAGAGPGTYQVGITSTVVAGTNSTTLANWQTTTGKEANSKNAAAVYLSATNLHLDNTNASNGTNFDGTAVASLVANDIDCDTRNVTTPDMGADEFSPPACTTAVAGTATGSTSFCVSGTPTITASGASTGTGQTIQWYSSTVLGDYPNAGTAVSGQTNPAALTTGVVSTTTYYWLRVTCATNSSTSNSNLITVTINPAPATVTVSTAGSYCVTTTITAANGGDGTIYFQGTTSGGTSTATPSASQVITTSGTYYFRAQSAAGCWGAEGSAAIVINPLPAAPSVTPTVAPAAFCLGGSQALTAGTAAPSTILTQNFETGLGTWTTANTSTGTTPAAAAWTIQTNPFTSTNSTPVTFNSNSGTKFIVSNSDLIGSGAATNTVLTSPSFSPSAYSALSMTYKLYYKNLTSGTAEIFVEAFNGSTWSTVQSFSATQGTATAFVAPTAISLPLNTTSVRFRYTTGWGWYVALDDISITGTPIAYNYSWTASSANAGLPAGAGTASAGNASISVTPTQPGSYTYTATAVNAATGCASATGTTTASVTVSLQPAVNVGGAVATICQGGTSAALGGSYSNNATGAVWSDGGAGGSFANNTGSTPGTATYTAASNAPASVTLTLTSTGGTCGTTFASKSIAVTTGTIYYADTDTDGFGDPASTQVSCSGTPSGYVANNTDCAPSDGTKWQLGNFYTDADNDGYNNGAPLTSVCYGNSTPSGYTPSNIGTDCLDSNFEVNPNHVEVLGNGIDDNCDGNIDEVAPTSSLQPSQCGITLTNIAQAIYANVVTGAVAAQGYRFEVTEVGNPANVRIYDAPSNSFNLNNLVGGGVYNTTYSIRVAVKTAPGFWRAYAAACTVSTPAVAATTKVQNAQCGTTLTNIDATIYCDAVTNATGYRFRVSDGVTTQTYDTTVNRFSLTSSPLTASFGTTYAVDVQLKFGTTWETTWGTVCNITTPLTPGTSNVSAAQCGTNITNLWATIYATQIAVATGYRFEVTKSGGGTVFYDTPNARFSLRNITVPGFTTTNSSYSIRVAILFNSVYQPFGSACTITTTGASRITNTPIEVFEVKAYPNPFAANFKLDINTSSEANVNVKVYDMIGREIEARQANVADMTAVEIGNQYPTGVYNIVVTQGDKVKSLRVIKR